MPPVLVQSAAAHIAGPLAGNIVLPAAPTPGNLLVLHAWARNSASWGIPTGLTEQARFDASSPFLVICTRPVVAGDSETWPSGAADTRALYLAEWSGLGLPTGFLQGALANTDPTNIDPGDDYALGIYAVATDIGGREVHVIAPSTIDYERWVDGSVVGGFGPYGSVGHGPSAGSGLDIQATSGAISFHVQRYIVGNYPAAAGGGGFAGEPGGGLW